MIIDTCSLSSLRILSLNPAEGFSPTQPGFVAVELACRNSRFHEGVVPCAELVTMPSLGEVLPAAAVLRDR